MTTVQSTIENINRMFSLLKTGTGRMPVSYSAFKKNGDVLKTHFLSLNLAAVDTPVFPEHNRIVTSCIRHGQPLFLHCSDMSTAVFAYLVTNQFSILSYEKADSYHSYAFSEGRIGIQDGCYLSKGRLTGWRKIKPADLRLPEYKGRTVRFLADDHIWRPDRTAFPRTRIVSECDGRYIRFAPCGFYDLADIEEVIILDE